jgi:putative oxidoreductase
MKKPAFYIIELVRFLLIILWVYTAVTKLSDFRSFRVQMQIQPLPLWLTRTLVYLIPGSEIIAAALLLFVSTLKAGLYLTLVLMSVFTGYIGLVLLNYFGRTPCSCGGVIGLLNWQTHFLFNIFFVLLTCFGIYNVIRERRRTGDYN